MRWELTTIAVLAVVLALVAAGCSAERPALSAHHEGTTAVLFEDHLPAELRISRVVAKLDGEVVYRSTVGSPSSTLIFEAPIAPGEHGLEVQLAIEVPCGIAGERHDSIEVDFARGFLAGPGGGVAHVDVLARAPWLELDRRAELKITLRGLEKNEHWHYAWTEASKSACEGDPGVSHARCLATQLRDEARAARDVVKSLCAQAKLDAIDAGAGDERDGARAEALAREAEDCVGEQVGFIASPSTRWAKRECALYERDVQNAWTLP